MRPRCRFFRQHTCRTPLAENGRISVNRLFLSSNTPSWHPKDRCRAGNDPVSALNLFCLISHLSCWVWRQGRFRCSFLDRNLFFFFSAIEHWGRYHGGRRPSSDDSFHSPTVIPRSALDKPSIMKRYHRRRTCSHTSLHRSPTMVTLHDIRFVEYPWWNDGWTVKTVVT